MGRKAAFSVVEVIVGLAILTSIVFAANNIFKPVVKAAQKTKLLNSMMKIENLIREEVYLQSDYTDLSKFEIKYLNTVVAKHGVSIYVSEDLTASSQQPIYPLKTKLEVVDFDSGTKKGVLYQIGTSEKESVRLFPLGVADWPTSTADMQIYLLNANSGNMGATSSTILIPPTLYNSTFQKCEDGFIRGISNGRNLLCWNFVGDKQCPSWALPVGYKINNSTFTVELLCQRLNRLTCPPMATTITDPTSGVSRNISLENFYSLNTLDKRDLFPPKRASTNGFSECKSIVDFAKQNYADTNGRIPASVVTANAGLCPDVNMYTLVGGECVPTFQLSSIAPIARALIPANSSPILTATEARRLRPAE